MESIKALIVDDEQFSRENLATLIKNYCPELKVVGQANSAKTAKELIEKLEPQVLFLDINMPSENGFDLLNSIPDKKFCIVFATAHNEYGVQAVKANAVDYLLKPFDVDELKLTTKKIIEKLKMEKKAYANGDDNSAKQQKVIINHFQGFSIIDIEEIIKIEGDSNYSKIFVKDGNSIITSKNLGEFEEILDSNYFYRIHKSYIINLKYLKEYNNIDGGFAVMSDNSRIIISRRRYPEFINKIKNFTFHVK